MAEARHFGKAWLALAAALALHVLDEALTGFLDVYNPTVLALRENAPWLPLPVFRFDVWLGGLIAGVLILLLLSKFAFRGAHWLRPPAFVLAVLMLFNGLSHIAATIMGRTVESVRLAGPMPGVYSSPVLVAASIWLLVSLLKPPRRPSALP